MSVTAILSPRPTHGTKRKQNAPGNCLELISESGVTTVRVVYSDQHGIDAGEGVKRGQLPAGITERRVADTFSNLGKDTSNTPVFPLFDADGGFGVEQMGGAGDMLLAPDPMTFKILPWTPDTAWIIADMYLKDRTRMPFDTRQLMRNALNALNELNYSYIVGLELEFYVFVIEDEKLSLSESGHPPEPPAVRAISPRLSIPCRTPHGQGRACVGDNPGYGG